MFSEVSILYHIEWKTSSLLPSLIRPLLPGQPRVDCRTISLWLRVTPTFSFSLSSSRELLSSPEILQLSIPALGFSSFSLHVCSFQCDFSWARDSELMCLQCSEGKWRVLMVLGMSSGTSFECISAFWVACKSSQAQRMAYYLPHFAASYLSDKNVREQLCDISSFTFHKANQSQFWLSLQIAEIRTFHLQNTNPTNKLKPH